ncbi:MAG: acetate uptake transporter [Bacteroidales bacterium]|jgi:hypothetical protein
MENSTNEKVVVFKDTTSNPAPIGLFGFGITTVLLNLHNAGFYNLSAGVLSTGIFVGGIAQVIAGVLESKKNNTFGATAFTLYGFFWISLVSIVLLPVGGIAAKPFKNEFAAYLFLWGVFSLVMFVATLKLNRALQVIFFTLFILFFLLSFAKYFQNETLETIAGWEGMLCGFSAIYLCFANILNEVYGKTILPVGPMKK